MAEPVLQATRICEKCSRERPASEDACPWCVSARPSKSGPAGWTFWAVGVPAYLAYMLLTGGNPGFLGLIPITIVAMIGSAILNNWLGRSPTNSRNVTSVATPSDDSARDQGNSDCSGTSARN